MDNAWQMKCDSAFQSSKAPNVQSPEPTVLAEITANHYLLPQVAHGLRSEFAGGKLGHVYPSFLHSTTNASGHADTENSFLALLHGPPSLLQGDLQELTDRQLGSSSGGCTPAIGNSVVDSIESEAFLSSSPGVMTENLINHHLQSQAYTSAEVSFPATVSLSGGGDFIFHHVQSSNTATQPMIAGGEKPRESFFSSGQYRGTSPTSSLSVCCADIQTAPNMDFEQLTSKYATPSMNGCPRVFCMGRSGYLLLSNTGLLGIVCSCHYFHMSVLRFCEHSGLHGVNPGEAVYMESGETILQWQKLYFSMLGIRSPGNESEWDWPELLSTTGSLMKSNASASDMSKTDLSHISSSSSLLRKQPTTIQDGFNTPLKGFTGISQNNLYDQKKSQLMESNLAMYTLTPNFFGTKLDNGCQPIPTYLDSLKGKGNLSTTYPPSHFLSSLLNGHERIKKKNVKDGLVGREAASSNIELRLGQPPQTGNPVPSFLEPPLYNALGSPPKWQPLKQMINNLSRDEGLKNSFNHAAVSLKMVKEQPQLKPRNYMPAVSNTLGARRARSEANNVSKGLLFSPFQQFGNQPKGKTKAGENLVNGGERIMPTMQFCLTDVPWNSNDHVGRQSNNSAPGNNKYLDIDKGVSFAKDSRAKIDSGFGISQLREYPSSITGSVGNNDSCISVVNGKFSESRLPSDTFVNGNFLHGSKSVSSLGQDNHVTPQMAIPFKGILKGLPYPVSSSTSNQIPTSPQQQGINMDAYLLDENTRLLALMRILEISKQQHAFYFHDRNQKQGRSSSNSKVPHIISGASILEQRTSDTSLKLLQSRGTCEDPESNNGLEKLASLTGFNRCLSGFAPIPLHSKEKELQCKHTFILQNEVPSLSLGIDRDKPRASACEKCSEQPSDMHLGGKYTSAARVDCFRSNFSSGSEPFNYILKQFPNASGKSSSMTVSDLSRDPIHLNTLKDENILSEQGGKLNGQDPIKIGSCPLQQRDVPSKVRKAPCVATSLDERATTGLDWEGKDCVQLGNISAKRIKRTIDMRDLLNKQEKKNSESVGILNSSTSLFREMQTHFVSGLQISSNESSFVQPSNKEEHSAFSSKFVSCMNHLKKHYSDDVIYESESNSDTECHTLPKVSGTKKSRKDFSFDSLKQFQMQESAYEEPGNAKPRSFSCEEEKAFRITRPIVCGKYGEICNGESARGVPKPAKIVSLSKVLRSSRRCMIPTNSKCRLTTKKKWKRLSTQTSNGHCNANHGFQTKEEHGTQNTIISNETNVNLSKEDLQRSGKPHVIYKVKKHAKVKQGNSIVNRIDAPFKVKSKEFCKERSINELTSKEPKVKDMLNCAEDRELGLWNTRNRNCVQHSTSVSIINSDASCCVCRSSSNDNINCLLECSQCLIRVHQACYGISTLPKKGRWCCRPCRTNSTNIACVLCGYGGGAMTRAILSDIIVKGLLKVWNVEKDGMPKHTTSSEVFEYTPSSVSNCKVQNSITAGVFDPTVKQWVHMVCGLWTPGTRCPNVDTMSAFDVSGISRSRADVVCSICNRVGGSCVECRISGCPVKFHPWCAHQKNLLQSETEGVDDEMIGFYGTCMLHSIEARCQSTYGPVDEMGSEEEKEFSCARAEGYKGRRWDGFQNSCHRASKARDGCLVPEEQLNAWIHINGHKLCSQGLPKFPDLAIESDCREYTRYKQAKGWKHLVVYKSRIHALGLYTSRVISQGQMVVEYVGEIVGLHVADKRENEYQSGRKVQYKSACYFFRIDEEHIIDATRKGGIARFVNHSCLPNCVAKVITVKHEKKVVFFAERDIFPGEEITYDYHFNHEDEGKKIPCYCNSKNCRRYMN